MSTRVVGNRPRIFTRLSTGFHEFANHIPEPTVCHHEEDHHLGDDASFTKAHV